MEIHFRDRAVLITGATSGIGEATAKLFAQKGASVFITGRNGKKLNDLKALLESYNHPIAYQSGDLTQSQFREDLIEATVGSFGKLDILINSAGIINAGTIKDTSLKEYDEIMEINLRTILHLMQLAIPHLKKTKGNIINVSSVAGLRSFPGILAYCISKAGLDQLTRCAALELASEGIRVNAVNPGVVKTNLHIRSFMDEDSYEKFLKHSQSTHPLRRVGTAEEIAQLIAFLASDCAGWITGTTYSIDGGRFLTCAR